MERLWNGWRLAVEDGVGSDGMPHANVAREDGKSLFEAIEQSGRPDEETYIVWRGADTFAILNVFPYTSGHLMVLPKMAVAAVDDLDDHVFAELWFGVRSALVAVKTAFGPDGTNVGLNEGVAGGGSIPDHLHVHVVPRWRADTNFMTSTANTRLLPVPLSDTWRLIREAWPETVVPDLSQ